MRFLKALALASLLSGVVVSAKAEDVINAVHFTPAQNGYAQSFLKFVKLVNEKGKGVVRIDVRGGPEVIPYPQLGTAQKSGLIDMLNAPAGAYLEMVPEGEVFSASTIKPWDARANGGWDFVNGIYEKKGNAHLLAHIDAGTGFHMFTVNKPEMTEDGAIDFTKLKIRASPLYRQFFEALGASVIVQNATDVYTSLERGVINANAYPVMGYASFGWDKFTKYRIDPSFFQVDVLVSMNKKKWDSLSDESKKILNEVSVEYEKQSYEANLKETDRLAKEMIDNGQQVVEMTGEGRDKFLATAAKASWDRMTERDPTNIETLHKYFP
ncbi:TRAP transporter substrate-binding protein DctP [Rhizobium halophytocola]|uniref:TRAP-type C4-dicarboxylate transport system substrate-binding protein n=1 Tax=Rhizobium halophytocola TaxID=735519 RepID=A0ABS4DV87_9HYPH|nr:TRAP transporter substrate-binding protein DctP [Rhizobium halophytocola]MBP1849598.1 TRAP-type C4-dicarboxylate transport system substrate-binding protein [Rhizobium halophytocola]